MGRFDHFKVKLERIGAALTEIKGKKFTDCMQMEAKLVENARRKQASRDRLVSVRGPVLGRERGGETLGSPHSFPL